MKAHLQSIQWRLQVWHSLVLLLLLAVFGFTAHHLLRQDRFQQIDKELEACGRDLGEEIFGNIGGDEFLALFQQRKANSSSLSPGGASAGAALPDAKDTRGSASSDNVRLIIQRAHIKEREKIYFVFLERNGTILRRSQGAPSDIGPVPEGLSTRVLERTRGRFREHVFLPPAGFAIILGRSIEQDLEELRRLAWIMALLGGSVVTMGLWGGRWLASRAVRPIAEISAVVRAITSGHLSGRINIAQTDSEFGQLAADLNATLDRLESAFRDLERALERQKQFTADASHELRTPIAVMLAEVSSALARERTGADYREALESCRRATRRMQRLTESLLTLARLDSGAAVSRRESFDLGGVSAEAVELLRPLAEEHQIQIQADITPTRVTGNANQAAQVVSNLLSNAICYNHPGGHVRVLVQATLKETTLVVSDDGQGISPKDLPLIFERFYRADESRAIAAGHTGLGLAIAKGVAEAHGWEIQAESEPGCGSAFTVRIPSLIREPASPGAESAAKKKSWN